MTGRRGFRWGPSRSTPALLACALAGALTLTAAPATEAATTTQHASNTQTASPQARAPLAAARTGRQEVSSRMNHSRTSTPIKHFVMLMQGDRTFDDYFGTYPGADGLPSGACQAFVLSKPQYGCARPYPAHGLSVPVLAGGRSVVTAQYNGGKMDGFVAAYHDQGRDGASAMAYYDRRDLPFTWAVADQYVLFDKFFSADLYGTRLNRSYWVSAAPAPGGGSRIPAGGYGSLPTIFDRLQAAGVSWKFYVQGYNAHQNYRSAPLGQPLGQTVRVPLLNYARFIDNPSLARHIVDLDQYTRDIAMGTLPAVAYIASSGDDERSARSMRSGQALEQRLTTQLMLSRYWTSTAFLWTYDGSGGWYDHVVPPVHGKTSFGLRVPALLVSSYARRGFVDHSRLSYASALRFIEDNWAVEPLTTLDRDANSLVSAFDFSVGPRPAALITLERPPAAQVVAVPAVYGAYGIAVAAGMLCFVGALLVLHRSRLPRIRSRGGGGSSRGQQRGCPVAPNDPDALEEPDLTVLKGVAP